MARTARELLILRHAKSSWASDAPTDFARPLAPRGKRDAPRVARWLRAHDLLPFHAIGSPARRAAQTLYRIFKELELDRDAIAWDERIYEAGLAVLLAVLADAPADAPRVLLVGHNPGLELLVDHLSGGEARPGANGKLLPTAALAHFGLPADWRDLARGSGALVRIVRPKELA